MFHSKIISNTPSIQLSSWSKPAGIYLFEVNNGNTKAIHESCSKLAKKTLEQNNVIDVVLVTLLLTLNADFTRCFGVPIVDDIEQVSAGSEWLFNEKRWYFLDRCFVI